jgi:hypothetical protein
MHRLYMAFLDKIKTRLPGAIPNSIAYPEKYPYICPGFYNNRGDHPAKRQSSK